VFGNPTPGNDAQIEERDRLLALLDLPRPEMIINAWVIQNSTSDPHAMGEFSGQVRTLVERYNQSLERMILEAYGVVSGQMLKHGYFNDAFYHYISDQFVAEGDQGPQTAQEFLDRSSTRLADNPGEERTNQLGLCRPDRYCLGYKWLFHPAKPRLTDLLLALIAAKDPFNTAIDTINRVQGTTPCCDCLRQDLNHEDDPVRKAILKLAFDQCQEQHDAPHDSITVAEGDCKDCRIDSRANVLFDCDEPGVVKDRQKYNRCITIVSHLALRKKDKLFNYLDPRMDCTVADQWGILRSQFTGYTSEADWRSRVQLACFARAAQLYLKNAGLARAAVADFLFHYKRSLEYPHEFTPYYLSQSAANLNSALSPIIDAFNRDIVAYQTYMRTDLEYEVEVANRGNDRRCCVKRLFGLDKPSFFNDGIVSVRTISGQSAQVKASSQSFLDASKAPSLSDLMSAIGNGGGASASSSASALLGAAPVSLLSGLLSSYQKTYAQIGRSLQLQAVPRTLATASAAEISVYLQAADPASTPVFSGGPPSAQQQNNSEVSNHEVTTRIRIDSVKLFELSSYSAVLQRSRSKIPLVPPLVEIPYIGTLAGIPVGAAKEYHQSTAVISAMVVPTAVDIGYGLRFSDDLVLYGPAGTCRMGTEGDEPLCNVRRALAGADLHAPLQEHHDRLILCLSTEVAGRQPATLTGLTSFSSGTNLEAEPEGEKGDKQDACSLLTFKRIPHE
jgi:hypothetical protein